MATVEARIVAVGDELLNGRTLDANSHELQQRLARLGVSTTGVAVVPDRADAIATALDATPDGALVVITGGLGPTPDDLTAETVAAWADAPLVADVAVTEMLRARCEARGRPFGPNMVKQGLLPSGLAAVANPLGTAPAMIGPLKGRTLVVLPGVPAEMRALWELVVPHLRERGLLGAPRPFLLRRTARLGEPSLAARTAPIREAFAGLDWSWWMTRWGVDVQAVLSPGAGDALPEGLVVALDAALGDRVWSDRYEDLPDVVLRALVARGATVAVAESCTGGMLGAALTDPAGASDAFRGGVIAYADAVKHDLLGVPTDVLVTHGAVSAPCAAAMAAGCRDRFDVDVALAVTGVAGPGGGSDEKPVGTVWFGLAAAEGVWTGRADFPGRRARNRELSVAIALDALRRHLADGGDPFGASGWSGWS